MHESTSPRLFSLIRRVAAGTQQEMPADVYLLNDVNAFVTQRGGTMGFGSHRVMGIGLPLLQSVSVAGIEAIIAHEFGHYSSGDVALGPWIYKTRAAVMRTIASLRASFVRAPFLWYARHFLKLTHAVSRRQEYIADQVAARVAGVDAMASALRRVSVAAPLYAAYLHEEVAPALNAGLIPPIAAGFNEFLAADRTGVTARHLLQASRSAAQTNVFDTHPSLGERLAALGVAASSDLPNIGMPAAALLEDHRAVRARAGRGRRRRQAVRQAHADRLERSWCRDVPTTVAPHGDPLCAIFGPVHCRHASGHSRRVYSYRIRPGSRRRNERDDGSAGRRAAHCLPRPSPSCCWTRDQKVWAGPGRPIALVADPHFRAVRRDPRPRGRDIERRRVA